MWYALVEQKKPRQSNASAKRRTKEVICHAARKKNRFPGIARFHQAAACLHDPALYIGFSFHYAHQYANHSPDLLGGRILCGGGKPGIAHLYIDRLSDERYLRRRHGGDCPELRQPGHRADESGCRTHSLDDLSVRHSPEPGTDPVPKAHSDSPVSPGGAGGSGKGRHLYGPRKLLADSLYNLYRHLLHSPGAGCLWKVSVPDHCDQCGLPAVQHSLFKCVEAGHSGQRSGPDRRPGPGLRLRPGVFAPSREAAHSHHPKKSLCLP